MKINLVLLRVAGITSLLFMLFHIAFYKVLNWGQTLNCLDTDNRAIFLTYHYISILILGFMAIIPLFQGKALLSSSVKYSVLSFFSLFYLIRIVTEFTNFGFSSQSPVILIMCAIPMLGFLIPILRK